MKDSIRSKVVAGNFQRVSCTLGENAISFFLKKKEKKRGVGGSDNFCVYRLLLPWLAILNSLEAPNKISFIRITDENFKMEDYNNYKVSSKRPEVPSCFPGSEVVSHAVHVVGANTYLPFAVQCQHIDVCC